MTAAINQQPVPCGGALDGSTVRVRFTPPVEVRNGQTLRVTLARR